MGLHQLLSDSSGPGNSLLRFSQAEHFFLWVKWAIFHLLHGLPSHCRSISIAFISVLSSIAQLFRLEMMMTSHLEAGKTKVASLRHRRKLYLAVPRSNPFISENFNQSEKEDNSSVTKSWVANKWSLLFIFKQHRTDCKSIGFILWLNFSEFVALL